MNFPIRINKYLRDKGVASRREADELVARELVLINGSVATSGTMVREDDCVIVKDHSKNYLYYAYYKPRGLATQDLPDKKSVITLFKEKGVYPIGRLDKESEGLLLLTNDGRFVREVLSQKEEWEKEYLVTVQEDVGNEVARIFSRGMDSRRFGRLLPAPTKILDKNSISIVLREGKKHQIRVMLSELSYTVTSLTRVRIGRVCLDGLNPGEDKEFTV